jgi:alkylglycerol monooxygenase
VMVGATAAFLLAGPDLPLANGLVVFLGLTAALWAMGAVVDGRISITQSLFVFCAALNCAAYALGWEALHDLANPVTMALLIAAVVTREGQSDLKRLVIGALLASLIGDTLLLRPSLFAAGLVAFLIAHGFYIMAFTRGVGFLPSRAALAAIAAVAGCILFYIWPGVGAELRAPVVVYVGVIALMAAQAAGRASVLGDRAAIAAAAGALMFMVSDTTLALAKFSHAGWLADQWTLPTYYLAQALIAFCVPPRTRPAP